MIITVTKLHVLTVTICLSDTVAYRQTVKGSFLIQYVVEVLNAFADKDDIEELFRKVCFACANCSECKAGIVKLIRLLFSINAGYVSVLIQPHRSCNALKAYPLETKCRCRAKTDVASQSASTSSQALLSNTQRSLNFRLFYQQSEVLLGD